MIFCKLNFFVYPKIIETTPKIMIENLPQWTNLLFVLTSIMTLLFFYLSNSKPRVIIMILLVWALVHCVLAYIGFYHNTSAFPPRFGLVLIPSLIFIIYGVLTKQRTWIYRSRKLSLSTALHIVRLPVELVLYQLFIYKMVPELMTFEGRNFDIIIGLTAPLMAYLYYKKIIGEKLLLVWNIIGLLFILFIFINGMLSAELPFQIFAFDQPNVAVEYFPFVLLPALIVPMVIWTHMTDIFLLRKKLKEV